MPATVTATGVAGPAVTVTAGVFANVTKVLFDTVANVLELTQSDPNRILQIAITAATTITATKSGSTYTFTIS
jgi:hypothetical protein